MPTALSLLAHQGGWDEILLVAAPIVVLAALLLVADRRAKKLADARRAGESPETEQADSEAG